MADEEHLDILKQGVEIWNQWRAGHHILKPDLSKANLSGAALSEVVLNGAVLTQRRAR